MADKSLVIVESPTKARTISQFLGKRFIVKASNGHIRDLPNSAAEIPPKLKKEPWSRLGVNVENDFEALYIVPTEKKDHVKKLKDALAEASELYLATDEDREGESISWHLVEVLKPKIPVKRLVFHEITKEAIQASLDAARNVDENLVKAQETRRIVDRLYGYEVSPLLWKKMVPGLSAGRVQSVAIRLLVDRERERIRFVKAQYWGMKAEFGNHDRSVSPSSFEAELTQLGSKRVATGKDFDAATGKLSHPEKVIALSEKEVLDLQSRLQSQQPTIASVEEKPFTSKPSPPFVTSTLQQEANRKLRYSAKRTMTIAQRLYENGFITYMRTDSTTLSEQAITAARTFIASEYGSDYLPAAPRVYTTKVRNAQEAHEAIRPAGESFTSIENVRGELGPDAARLYELIWKRTVACQMADAKGTHIAVSIKCDDAQFRASGKTISFPGFLRAYVEGSDDPDEEMANQERILPALAEGEKVSIEKLEPLERSTQPPPRYTEGSLIKELERRGIGRPSTWATVVDTVLNRSYGFKKGTALVPTFTAIAVVGLLEKNFENLLDYEFTARLEDDLDAISRGEAQNLAYLKTFYFGNGHPGLKKLVKRGEETIDPREVNGIPIGREQDGSLVEVRIGRYGPYLTNGTHRASVPDVIAPDELTLEAAREILEVAAKGPEAIGQHPETNEPIYLKVGPYGPYVQLGEGQDGEKPKMASLLSTMDPHQLTVEQAVKLLSLPRNVGQHPEMNDEVIVANGRYGPYVKCGAETRSINLEEFSPLDMTLQQAIEVLKQPKGRRGASKKPASLREVGAHPVSGKQLVIKSGRYGPYVTDGEINASLRKGMEPETLTLDDAVELLEARAAKIAADGGTKKTRGAKKSTEKKAAKSKKAAAKSDDDSAGKSKKSKSTTKRSKKKKSDSAEVSAG